jgi:hypothetical protein
MGLPGRQRELEQIHWSPFQPSPEAALRVLPRDELNGSTVDLPKTPVDLVAQLLRRLRRLRNRVPPLARMHKAEPYATL